jgi:DNA processing protein
VLKYWLWLTTRKRLGNRGALAVLRHFASPEEAFFASEESLGHIDGLTDPSPLLDKDLTEAERILGSCYRLGIRILTMQDAAYPERLRNIDDPPVLLYCRGTVPAFDTEPVLGIVGTRQASAYGLVQAKQLGYQIGRMGGIVVSGAAAGIDTLSLKGALTAGRPVVGVLGCGIDVVYPANNRGLYEDIAQYGCLMSEYPPGTPPLGEHFPVRNRIISGLSLGIVVIEAPKKSGALITARCALEQGRDVFAVPGNVGVESCEGNIQLLKEGAIVVEDGWDVMKEYVRLFPELAKREPTRFTMTLSRDDLPDSEKISAGKGTEPGQTPGNTDKKDVDKPETRAYIDVQEILNTLSPDERAIVLLLQDKPMQLDDVIDACQLPAGRVLASVTLLEMKGYVKRLPGKRFSLAEKEG